MSGDLLEWAGSEGTSDYADEVTLSRKGAKDRTRVRKLRSTGTKAKTRVAHSDKSRTTLITKLEAHARDLEKKLETRTRELSEALKRRCLFLHIDYPDIEREKEIVRVRVPEVDEALSDQIAKVVGSIRNIDLKKAPSISETIDWARTRIYLGRNEITPEVMGETLHVLLKYQTDITKARKELGVDAPATPARR